ncbi:MAG: hypothetical protein Kow0062_11710 [Acidobacteriota bacterium]
MIRPIPLLLALSLVAGASTAGAGESRPDPTPEPPASSIPADPAGRIALDAHATAEGLEYRRLTPIAPREWRTVDPFYRWLLERIAAGTADRRVMRYHHWLQLRLAPWDRPIPAGWRAAALPRLLARRPAAPSAGDGTDAPSIPQAARWLPLGPWTIPGRVTGLARPGGRPGWIAASLADGGLWLTRDAGASWEPLAEREATQAGGSVAADPRDPARLYWGTGEGNAAGDNYGGVGLLSSLDGGRTWRTSNLFSTTIRCLALSPADRQQLWACGDDGIWRSDDGGLTFARVEGGLPAAGGTAIRFRPDVPTTVFAGMWDSGLWRSDDGGASWSRIEGGLPANLGRVDVALCRDDPDVMVVATGTNGGDVWRSTDGGTSWSQVADVDHCGGQCWYDNTVAIAPDDCLTIYLGGVHGWVSRDGGASFAQIPADFGSHADPTRVHVDHHAVLALDGGEVIVGTDGGVYRSTDYGTTWQDIAVGRLPSTQYYGVCGHDADAEGLAGGTQDNGSHARYTGQDWRWVLGGDGGMCAMAGDRILGEFQNTNLQRSTDRGSSFHDANAGINPGDPRRWVGVIEKDPSDPATLYVGTSRVYRTTDFHDTPWVQIRTQANFNQTVTALAVSPVDRNVLWAGYSLGDVWRTTNALAASPSWSAANAGLPTFRGVSRLVPDPADADAAWAVMSGFGNPRILRTADGGASWTDVTGDLPDLPVNDLVVDPAAPSTLVAATDLGIFRSDDGGTSWYGFSDGLPLAAVVELFRHPADGALVAGTHGRGVFRLAPAAPGPVAVPDGTAPGTEPLRAARTEAGALWLRWDTGACTAQTYHLLAGPLEAVAAGAYDEARCGLDRGGEQVVAMPHDGTGSAFFLVVGATLDGTEGPHGHRSDGSVRPWSGSGFCGLVAQDPAATCP